MKLFFGEFPANYSKYYFPYQVWLLKEEGDDIGKIYESGFLPIRNMPSVYYLSRSTRVDLANFESSSENRRIFKKTEMFESSVISLSQFDYTPGVQKFCVDYAKNKLGTNVFPAQAVKSIFKNDIFSHVFVFKEKSSDEAVGYSVCMINGDILQYAHAFYDLEFAKDNLGARMMLEAVSWAKENNKKFIYLGTCYEEGSLYKTEFKGFEFFNGFKWSDNLNELKELINNKNDQYLLKDVNFINKHYNESILELMNKYGVRVNI